MKQIVTRVYWNTVRCNPARWIAEQDEIDWALGNEVGRDSDDDVIKDSAIMWAPTGVIMTIIKIER